MPHFSTLKEQREVIPNPRYRQSEVDTLEIWQTREYDSFEDSILVNKRASGITGIYRDIYLYRVSQGKEMSPGRADYPRRNAILKAYR